MSENTTTPPHVPPHLVQQVKAWASAMADSPMLRLEMSLSGMSFSFNVDEGKFVLWFHPSHWGDELRDAIAEGMGDDDFNAERLARELCDRLESDYRLLLLQMTISSMIEVNDQSDDAKVKEYVELFKKLFPEWSQVNRMTAQADVAAAIQEWQTANPGEMLTTDVLGRIVEDKLGGDSGSISLHFMGLAAPDAA